MSCVQLSEGEFQVSKPPGLWLRLSGAVKGPFQSARTVSQHVCGTD